MKKKLNLFLIFIIILLCSIWIENISNKLSSKKSLIVQLFPDSEAQENFWIFENKKWKFSLESKSKIYNQLIWSVLESNPISNFDNKKYFSISVLDQNKAYFLNKDFDVLDINAEPHFEIRKFSHELEVLIYKTKDCAIDFCKENLRLFKMDKNEFKDLGSITLSASNLLHCKKNSIPCFEFFGTFTTLKYKNYNEDAIKITFTGFEEDNLGKSKPLQPNIYVLRNSKFILEDLIYTH